LVLALVSAQATGVTPVQKVVELMEGMLIKGKAEKHEEQVQYAAYRQFCTDLAAEKRRAIEQAEESIVSLKAEVQKSAADAKRLSAEIAAHNEDMASWASDIKKVTEVRKVEKVDYQTTHKDYSESIDALQRAIAVLKQQAHDRAQADSFLQLSALKHLRLLPDEARKTIDAFLEEDAPATVAASAPEADGYEFQSQGVIDMLSKLLEKFFAERTELEKEEASKRQAYQMLRQDLEAQIEEAKQDSSFKTEVKAKKLEAGATAKGDLKEATVTKDADEEYLSDLAATYDKKTQDYESRQALRAEELEAISKAIEIIKSKAVSGNAAKHLPSLVQRGTSLAALRAEVQGRERLRAARFLQGRASQLESRVLSTLADRMASDPFMKVRKMIKDLLIRLMEEANEEADHQGWCDKELATNEKTRKEKSDAVETLQADMDALQGSIAKLTEDIADLSKEATDLGVAMAKATELQQSESAENAQAIQDSQDAQTAVAQAIEVLKEFYDKAGSATALLQQQQQPSTPAIFDKPYRGMADENGGVVGMLEVIASDFARLEADTKSEEVTAQKEYDAFMTNSKTDKASKEEDIEHKTAKKQDEEQALIVKKSDLEGTQKELDAALSYFDKLKPTCVDAGVSYEDRVSRRKQEIESLQETLQILNGEDLP